MTDRRLHALVVADGGECHRDALDTNWPGWASGIGLVVAADGGARLADMLGLPIDRWVGDGDSIDAGRLAALQAEGIPTRLVSTDKDESDAELAMLEALDAGASELTILGALGGSRVDHTIANLGLLAHPDLVGRVARLLADDARVSLVRASDADDRSVDGPLPGRVGDLISLLPYGPGVAGVTTRGLRYSLRDESLPPGPARGLSNVRESAEAGVTLRRGLLLVIESPATLTS